jgi:hypothetical protein
MHSSVRRVAATTLAVLSIALGAAACGGGGGGTTGTVSPVGPETAPPQAPKSTVRATMQSALFAFENANGGSLAQTTVFGLARRVQAIRHGRRPLSTAPVCSNGHASAGPVVNPDGSQTFTDWYYYDAACAHIEEMDVVTVTQSTATAFAATSATTAYDQAGNVTSYIVATLQGTSSGGVDTITVSATLAKNATAAWFAKLGLTCTGPSTGTPVHCGAAAVDTVNAAQVGTALDETQSLTTSGATSTATVSVRASAYGAPSGLDIAPGAVPVWNVTGAPALDTVTGTTTITFSGSALVSGSLSLSDAATGITVTGTATPSKTTFTLVQNGTQLATATVDGAGTGTVTYADGTTEQITNWTISG